MAKDLSVNRQDQLAAIVDITVRALGNIIGEDNLSFLLKKAGLYIYPYDACHAGAAGSSASFQLPLLMMSLENQFGKKQGRRFARLTGKRIFPEILDFYGSQTGLSETTIAYVPADKSLSVALGAMAVILQQFGGQELNLSKEDNVYFIRIDICMACRGRNHAVGPACDLVAGLLEAGIGWFCEGVAYDVKEVQCQAKGDKACVFSVKKRLAR